MVVTTSGAALLVGGLAVIGYRVVGSSDRPVRVLVTAQGVDETVEVPAGSPVSFALAAAGVAPHDGRLLSVRDGRVLDGSLDPATITVDATAADLTTTLDGDSSVAVVDGEDRVEATETVPRVLEPAPYPDVMHHVQERSRAGSGEELVGVESREVVSRTTLDAPVDPTQTTRRVVALTFDDGPSTAWTPEVLRILAAKDVRATFCQVGDQVTRHPEIVRQVVAAGHQLCNHTRSHDVGLRGADQARLDDEIAGGRAAFTDAGLPDPPYYRPPGGSLSDAIIATARANGEQVIHWKVDTEDWSPGATPSAIIDRVVDQVDDGAVILLHDGGGTSRQATVDALGPIIDELRRQGYDFVFPIATTEPR